MRMICQQILWVEQETPDPEGCFQNDVDEEGKRREESDSCFKKLSLPK